MTATGSDGDGFDGNGIGIGLVLDSLLRNGGLGFNNGYDGVGKYSSSTATTSEMVQEQHTTTE